MLHPTSYYVRELKPQLPAESFQPARSRLLWLPVHLAVIVVATLALALGWVSLWFGPLLSLAIGASFSGITFLAHETLHGAVVRNGRVRYAVGFLGFLPLAVSPRLWIAWHNRIHHGNTTHIGVDPDAYPTIEEYRQNTWLRFVARRLWLMLVVGFTGQSKSIQLAAGRLGYLSPVEQRKALIETAAGIAFWLAVLVAIGPIAFLFAYIVPHLITNVVVMGFISTNHGLTHLTGEVNDPLLNSLSVTTPRWIDVLTLKFGFHVEHHLFPWMSSRHAPAVRDLVRARWPERYQSMGLFRALGVLFKTSRVYKDGVTKIDPETMREWPALGPGVAVVDKPKTVANRPVAVTS
jgi:fatty acid desaturase